MSRRTLLLAGLALAALTVAPVAQAQPGPDGGLYLTLEGGCYSMCGGQFDYYWTPSAGTTPGKAPLTISTPAYSPYHANVDYEPMVPFRFTGPGELKVSVGCEVPDAAGFEWDIRLIAGEERNDFRDPLSGCSPTVQTLTFPIDLTGAVVDGERGIHMSISLNGVNPQVGSTSQVYLVADDPQHPTAIFAPWEPNATNELPAEDSSSTESTSGSESDTFSSEAVPPVDGEKAPLGPAVLVALVVAVLVTRRRRQA